MISSAFSGFSVGQLFLIENFPDLNMAFYVPIIIDNYI